MTMDDDVDVREQLFHNAVREYIIWMLLGIILYGLSYAIVSTYRRKADKEDCYSSDTEDALVYRISLWLCTFTLAVSGGAVLLLPASIVANESLIVFPQSYYLKWVNESLILGFWNQIFFASNLSLFILMPFAYLFTESEGFPGSKKGIMSRVYETLVVLVLLSILVCGLAYVASALIDDDKSSKKALFDVWNFYLPYLYSCISLFGVVLLLICTPVGFATLFTVIGELVVKPHFLRDLQDELSTVIYEEETTKMRISHLQGNHTTLSNGHGFHNNNIDKSTKLAQLRSKLEEIQTDRQDIERRQRISPLRRNLGYPIVMLLLLALTAICVLMVAQNTIELLIGLKALPVGTKEMVLGTASLSALGPFGAGIEIVLILYLMCASLVGFYTLPLLRRLKPKTGDTPMTKIIGNCAIFMIQSSALPVLSRILGITNFDLIGNFRSIEWLGNFYIILSYNAIFAGSTALCLATKFTATVRKELWKRLLLIFKREKRTTSLSMIADSSISVNGETSHIKDE